MTQGFDKKAYNKMYREQNKEYFQLKCKEWRQNNLDYIKKTQKEYRFYKTGIKKPKFNKSQTISNWKRHNMQVLPTESWTDIFNLFNATTHCMGCDRSFDTCRKNVDHCHTTGYVRGIICAGCNHYKHDVFKHMF